MNTWFCVSHLSDQQLLSEVKTRAARERGATADLIAALMEIDSRRLYLGEGCSSLFTYCTQVLCLSEHAAYGRIEAARAARRFPIALDHLADGSLTLTTICLLAPLLTAENHERLLHSAHHKTKREVEHLVASLRPAPPVPTLVRKLPALSERTIRRVEGPALSERAIRRVGPSAGTAEVSQASPGPNMLTDDAAALSTTDDALPPRVTPPAGPAPIPSHPAVVRPLAPDIYKIQFTMSREMHDRLRKAQDLLRHVIPSGDPAAIFDRALSLLVKELEKTKHAATSRPIRRSDTNTTSRRVPAAIKRKVWARDAGQCAFVGAKGRCGERGFLEYHHLIPYAAGGPTTAENIELRCRAHNQHEATLFFGPMMVREVRAEWESSARSGPS